MKTLAASVLALALCSPALADAPPRSDVVKIRFAIRHAANIPTSTVDVVVTRSGEDRCATAQDTRPDRGFTLTACVIEASHLRIDWSVKGPRGTYQSTSSIPITPGATTELGRQDGPRVTVTIQ